MMQKLFGWNRYQFHFRVQTRWHRSPSVVQVFLVVEVNHIDFLEFSPNHTVAIQLCNAVSREIRNKDFECVCSFLQIFGNVTTERNGEECCHFLSIENNAGRLTNISEVEDVVKVFSVFFQQLLVGFSDVL